MAGPFNLPKLFTEDPVLRNPFLIIAPAEVTVRNLLEQIVIVDRVVMPNIPVKESRISFRDPGGIPGMLAISGI